MGLAMLPQCLYHTITLALGLAWVEPRMHGPYHTTTMPVPHYHPSTGTSHACTGLTIPPPCPYHTITIALGLAWVAPHVHRPYHTWVAPRVHRPDVEPKHVVPVVKRLVAVSHITARRPCTKNNKLKEFKTIVHNCKTHYNICAQWSNQPINH